jgi:hypothetical protein
MCENAWVCVKKHMHERLITQMNCVCV